MNDLNVLKSQIQDLVAKQKAPAPTKTDFRILNLACGRCGEARVLAEHVAHQFATQVEHVHFTGIDIRQRELDLATQAAANREKECPSIQTNFDFICGSAANLASHGELPEQFDLVFLRHQNFWDEPTTWMHIFNTALEKLSPDGSLVITSYFDQEHLLALQAIEHLGGKLQNTVANDASRQLRVPGMSIDRHLAHFTKE